jgi:hypothetical protein
MLSTWWIRWRLRQLREWLEWKVAFLLPRKIAALAAVRVVAEATTGRYSTTVVPELPAMEALKRWDRGDAHA